MTARLSAGAPLPATTSIHRGDLLFEIAPFVLGGTSVAVVIYAGVPVLAARGVEPLAAWMCLAVPVVFVPLIFYALLLLRGEAIGSLRDRLWLRMPSRRDWLWGLGGLLVIAGASLPLMALGKAFGWPPHPTTMPAVHGITADTAWMIGVWLVYWPFNILGEELIWRGVLLPRMELRFGRSGWAMNAGLWFVFHLAFGPGNLLVLLPTILVVPFVAQRRRNTWLGVFLHAGLSAPGFVAMALGAV
jgi:membrane protease YdiL (CAAX protease family)